MAKKLTLVNGIPRMVDEAGTSTIYYQTLTLVTSSPGAGEIVGPITAGTAITLPSSQTYTSSELNIHLNGQRLEVVLDYTYVGSIPRTQILCTQDLIVGDVLSFKIERNF